MTVNESPADRALRALWGMLFLASPVLNFHTMPYNFIGLWFVVTGVVGVCPLYRLLGINTARTATPAHNATPTHTATPAHNAGTAPYNIAPGE